MCAFIFKTVNEWLRSILVSQFCLCLTEAQESCKNAAGVHVTMLLVITQINTVINIFYITPLLPLNQKRKLTIHNSLPEPGF